MENVVDNNHPETTYVSSPQKERDDLHEKDDDGDISDDENSKQLVVYKPEVNLQEGNEPDPDPDPITSCPTAFVGFFDPSLPPRILPSVGAFTVQCAGCFKWRLIPTKEKYANTSLKILFIVKPLVSGGHIYHVPEDMSHDGSRLLAIDKSIAQPPTGWQRLLRIRGEGGSKFADVYYVAPSGKRLRSMVEIQKYLEKHPEYLTNEMSLSQFSFQIPRPFT